MKLSIRARLRAAHHDRARSLDPDIDDRGDGLMAARFRWFNRPEEARSAVGLQEP